ncbi:hypothetical protein B6J67_28330 [Klebsiella quasipneumoniae]|nr:hypothetical protein B6J67_28330 [Klebsiella quasipneumoniae]PLJ64241.1 hypothetical protein B6J68_08570 [Klebsiella quasipneumoniae]
MIIIITIHIEKYTAIFLAGAFTMNDKDIIIIPISQKPRDMDRKRENIINIILIKSNILLFFNFNIFVTE